MTRTDVDEDHDIGSAVYASTYGVMSAITYRIIALGSSPSMPRRGAPTAQRSWRGCGHWPRLRAARALAFAWWPTLNGWRWRKISPRHILRVSRWCR